jgi:alanyl-tRNA synthetase
VGSTDAFDVVDVQNYAGFIMHVGRVRDGAKPLAVGDAITVRDVMRVLCCSPRTHALVQTLIDGVNRARVTTNHTTTHMLNWALRRTCGLSVQQKGSKVRCVCTRLMRSLRMRTVVAHRIAQVVAELLRFDFAHDGAVGVERIAKVLCAWVERACRWDLMCLPCFRSTRS